MNEVPVTALAAPVHKSGFLQVGNQLAHLARHVSSWMMLPGCAPLVSAFSPAFSGVRWWSERQDLNLRRLGPKPSALARLSYAPMPEPRVSHNGGVAQ